MDTLPYRSILVTGAAGFIGGHVAYHLKTRYPAIRLHLLDNLTYAGSEQRIASILTVGACTFHKIDLADTQAVKTLIHQHTPEAILHFAAETHVDNSLSNALQFTTTNVIGTQNLLEACRTLPPQQSVKLFLYVSTDEVYGKSAHSEHPVREDQELLPTNPYAATKAAAEMLVKAYQASWNIPYMITRMNNVFGPWQHPEKVIPRWTMLLKDNNLTPLEIHGSGHQRRSYLYINDAVQAFMALLHTGKLNEIYNIGSNIELSVQDLALAMLELHKCSTTQVTYTAGRPFNDERYNLDTRKMQALGWQPAKPIDFVHQLSHTVNWYQTSTTTWKNAETQ